MWTVLRGRPLTGHRSLVPIMSISIFNASHFQSLLDYRPITLTPVVSKVFESVILSLCQQCFMTDELQFGFKQHMGAPLQFLLLSQL